MNQQETAKLVYMAVAAFPHLQGKDIRWRDTIRLWSLVLDDIPYRTAERALMEVLKVSRFFPAPAEVRGAALEISREDRRLEEHIQREVDDAWTDAHAISLEEWKELKRLQGQIGQIPNQ